MYLYIYFYSVYFDINNIYFYPIYIQFLFIYFPAMHPENPSNSGHPHGEAGEVKALVEISNFNCDWSNLIYIYFLYLCKYMNGIL